MRYLKLMPMILLAILISYLEALSSILKLLKCQYGTAVGVMDPPILIAGDMDGCF